MKYFKNLKQFKRWKKSGNIYQHKKGIQYKVIGFNFFSGKIIFRYNNYGIFGIVERDASDFIY